MSNNVPNHNVAHLIDTAPLKTSEVKAQLALFMGMNISNIHAYYNGRIKSLSLENAKKMLTFFNSLRDEKLEKLSYDDIYKDAISRPNNAIASKLNLTNSNDKL